MDNTPHTILDLLEDLGVCDRSQLEHFAPQVRDREDVAVLRCPQSGVIVLSRIDHMSREYYEGIEGFRYWSSDDRQKAINAGHEDKLRRKRWLEHVVTNKKWLDVGTGSGGILDALSSLACETIAVEPQKQAIECLRKAGHLVYKQIQDVPDHDFDVVSLFHVLEHFTDPLSELKLLRDRMNVEAKIYIEIPHANDFLLTFLKLEEFKNFTLWSEHLILHTRISLQHLLETAGFENIVIQGCQRYPLANHLHWLAKSKPGGHLSWDFLRTPELDREYENMLIKQDMSDTLLAIACK